MAKGSLRVSEHDFFRKYHAPRGWTATHSTKHRHAICFLHSHLNEAKNANPDVQFSKEATLDDLDKDTQALLRDALMKTNESWEKDAKWKQYTLGPHSLKYPGNTIHFDVHDPSKVKNTLYLDPLGPVLPAIVVRSERVGVRTDGLDQEKKP
eukprot:scaffold68139_cov33-Attheya_sp.AAC.1